MTKPLHMYVAVLATLTLAASGFAAPGGNGNGNGNGGENGHGQNAGGNGSLTSTGSISLDQAGQTLALGDSVTFTTSVSGLNGSEWPMVYVECHSEADGSLVYGELNQPDATFVLGGGSSDWLRVGGPADCAAHLYVYGGKTPGTDLASPVTFDADGA